MFKRYHLEHLEHVLIYSFAGCNCNEITEKLKKLEDQTAARFQLFEDQTEERLRLMDDRLSKLEERVDKNGKQQSKLEKRVDKNGNKLNKLEKRVDKNGNLGNLLLLSCFQVVHCAMSMCSCVFCTVV